MVPAVGLEPVSTASLLREPPLVAAGSSADLGAEVVLPLYRRACAEDRGWVVATWGATVARADCICRRLSMEMGTERRFMVEFMS
jgi:hypothetical protein